MLEVLAKRQQQQQHHQQHLLTIKQMKGVYSQTVIN
jgi:hypothetical protein